MIFTLEKSFPILPEDVYEPFEVSVRGADPEEVDLLTSHARVSVGRGSEHKVIED